MCVHNVCMIVSYLHALMSAFICAYVCVLSVSEWGRTHEAKWQACPKDWAEHVLAVTGVQTVTWLLWSALTSNEWRHTIIGSGGTRHSIMTKPMTCHLFNNIYSTEDCNPCHLSVSVWRATSLSSSVRSQPLQQECVHRQAKQNLLKHTQPNADLSLIHEKHTTAEFLW